MIMSIKSIPGINDMDELLTNAKACEYFRISPRKLDYLRSEGKMNYIKIGASIRFRKSDLRAYVEANTHRSTPCPV